MKGIYKSLSNLTTCKDFKIIKMGVPYVGNAISFTGIKKNVWYEQTFILDKLKLIKKHRNYINKIINKYGCNKD